MVLRLMIFNVSNRVPRIRTESRKSSQKCDMDIASCRNVFNFIVVFRLLTLTNDTLAPPTFMAPATSCIFRTTKCNAFSKNPIAFYSRKYCDEGRRASAIDGLPSNPGIPYIRPGTRGTSETNIEHRHLL